jgi:dipeptide/tripeptide permease
MLLLVLLVVFWVIFRQRFVTNVNFVDTRRKREKVGAIETKWKTNSL